MIIDSHAHYNKGCMNMKKLIALVLVLVCVLAMAGCGRNDIFTISITIPAGSQEAFVFADEEICPTGKEITVSCGEGLGETEVLLAPVDETVTAGYVNTPLMPEKPVTFDTDRGVWLKIGVAVTNDTDTDKTVHVEVSGVEVRIE